MITLRQIERLWDAESYDRILSLLLGMRPEASARLSAQLAHPVPTAAMIVIRLDELNQSHVPLCGRMIRTILAAQDVDGGFGDPLTTAVCLRALFCSCGMGPAIDRGLQYLASLQRPEGLWPKEPLRRMPPDPYVSAFILHQLGNDSRFSTAVRLDDALAWFTHRQAALDPETERLWKSISLRHQRALRPPRSAAAIHN